MEPDSNFSDKLLHNARAHLSAAHALTMRDQVDARAFLGPTLLLLGFGIEVMLKTVLLDHGVCPNKLGQKPYGHDIWAMWNCPQMEAFRNKAHQLLRPEYQLLNNTFISPRERSRKDPTFHPKLHRVVPAPETFERDLECLSKLHSGASNFALRYPVERVQVPDPMLLVAVFEALADCLENPCEIVPLP